MRKLRWTRTLLVGSLLAAGIAAFGSSAAVAGPAPVMFGYVPLPADHMQLALETIHSGASPTLRYTVGITNAAAGSTMYYDHWEDGYEADIANPAQGSTLVFGDGDTGNGNAATFCGASCTGDVLPQGAALIMQNDIPTPRDSSVTLFDGSDKIASTRGFAITAGGFTTPTGSVLATVVSAYDTSKYSTNYTAPVGTDTAVPSGTTDAFAYSGLLIQAAENNTLVEVDKDANGTFETTGTINEGKTMLVNNGVLEGASVRTSHPVMVHEITGDPTVTYESRTYNLFPDEVLWNDYMSPAGSSTTNFRTINFLYNPNNTAITVTPTCASCAGTLNVPANAGVSFSSPLGEAVRFSTTGAKFSAIAGVGAQSGALPGAAGDSSSAWDWGYSLIPTTQLTTQVVLGWAPGNSTVPPSASPGDLADNPVWFTSLNNTTLAVDFDGNPATGAVNSPDCFGARHDLDIPVTALASTRVHDPNDGDMTGARIYTCDGTALAGAWGEDPATAPAGSPGFDAGYTLIPTTTMLVHKSGVLTDDTNGDGKIGPGDTVTYVIEIADAGSLAFTNVQLADTLPAGMTYVAGSAEFDDGTNPPAPIADDTAPPAATAFPFDETGASLPNINAGQTVEVRFDVAIDDPFPLSTTGISNTACVTAAEATACDTSVNPLASADLDLAKVVTTPATHVGDNVTFRITATNHGPDAAPAVEVVDQLPTGLSFVSAAASQGTYNPGSGLWNAGTIPNGGNATLDITATVTALSVTNGAQVTSSGASDPDSQPAENPFGPPDQDDEATAGVTVAPAADLSLTKTVTSPPAFIGDNAVFDVTVSNAGPSTATGVVVTDALPAGLSFGSASATQGSYNSGTGAWTIGSVASGASATLTITAPVIAVGPRTNVAEVSAANENDPDSTPNNGAPNEDDRATATANAVGGALGDRIWDDVDGDGAQDGGEPGLTGVDVTLYRDVDINGSFETLVGTTTTSGGTYGFGDLFAGSYRIDIDEASLPAGYTCTNCLAPRDVIIVGGQTLTDADYGYRAEADLSLTKTVTTAPDHVGDTAVFDVVVSNAGPAAATGVTVTDVLPAGLAHQSSSATVGTYDSGSGVWTIGSIPSGGSATLTVTVVVNTAGTVTNTAEVSAAGVPDPDSQPDNHDGNEDDQASATISADPLVDLSLTKTVSAPSVNVGSNATFTIVVANAGPSDATGVTVDDTLPVGLTFVSANATSGAYNSGTGLWTVGTVPADGSVTLTIVATVADAGPIDNTAEVTAAAEFDADSMPGNQIASEDDQATATVTGVEIDLSLDVTVSSPSVNVGDTVDWVITVTNDGPSAASGVTVEDALPQGLTLIDIEASQGTYDPDTDTWAVGALPVDGTVTLTLKTRVDRAGAVVNTAQVSAAGEPDVDSTPDNNVASEDDQDNATVTGVPAALPGTIWVDTDNDGTIDPGEPLVKGVTVQLIDAAGNVVATSVTDANGHYAFSNVLPGTYNIKIDPSTLPLTIGSQVFDPDALLDASHTVVVTANGEILSTDFGYRLPAATTPVAVTAGTLPATGLADGAGRLLAGMFALVGALVVRRRTRASR